MSITDIVNLWSENTDLPLDISNLGLIKWPEILNSKLTKIKHLICSDNFFTQIPKLPVCHTLISTNGKLTKINTIKSVTNIDVRNNKLVSIPGLIKCVKAQLSNNMLKVVPKTLTKMKILDISNNPITNFSSRVPVLEILLCSECKFKTLPEMKKLKAIRYFGTSVTPPKGVRILTEGEGIMYDEKSREVLKESERKEAKVEKIKKAKVERKVKRKKVVKEVRVEKELLAPLDVIDIEEEEYTDTYSIISKIKDKFSKETEEKEGTKRVEAASAEEEDIIWNIIPETFGPIRTIPLDKIEVIREKKLLPSKKEITMEELGELEISEMSMSEFDDKEKDKDIMNLNEFINIFDLRKLPSSGSEELNYKGADIKLLAIKAGIPYVGYTDTIKRLIYVYVRQTNLLSSGLNFEKIEMIANIINRGTLKRKRGETDIELTQRWYERFNLKLEH